MNTVLIYDSKFGNTERIAHAIARGLAPLGDVHVVNTADVSAVEQSLGGRPDLLLVGGPTQQHGPSPALKAFLKRLPPMVNGIRVAAFDTRYRGSTWLMGSAAGDTAKAFGKAGSALVAPPESFFIERRGKLELQQLEAGEVDRAESWGQSLAKAVAVGRAE